MIRGSNTLKTFNPYDIINKNYDQILEKGDEITIYSKDFLSKKINLIIQEKNNQKFCTYKNTENKSQKILDNEKISNKNNLENSNLVKLNEAKLQEINKITDKTKTVDDSDLPDQEVYDSDKGNCENIKANFSQIMTSDLDKLIENSLIEIRGEVMFPGFYPIGGSISIDDLINLAGGLLEGADKKNIEINNKSENGENTNLAWPGSNILILSKNNFKSYIELQGSFENQRKLSFRENIKINQIIKSLYDFKQNVYIHFGVIKRKTTASNDPKIIPFSPSMVLDGKQNFSLEKGDQIYIFSNFEINKMINFIRNKDTEISIEGFNSYLITQLKDIILKNYIEVYGEVRNPNIYLFHGETPVSNVLSMAGGHNRYC